jgi:polyphenol oxidase
VSAESERAATRLADGPAPTDPVARLEPRGGLEVLVWPALVGLGVDALVTTRDGGVSDEPYDSLNLALHVGDDPEDVLENRRRAAGALSAGLDDLVFSSQVHGTQVAVVTAADRGRGTREQTSAIADVDALVTAEPGVILVTLVADCVPVLLIEPEARVLACAHAGWRGALSGVLEVTLQAMNELGGRNERTVAAIGPGIGADRYQVGGDVFEAARNVLGADTARFFTPDATDRWLFDLPGAVQYVLERAGVDSRARLAAPITTGGVFFSDRSARPCGRFGLLARLQP